MIHKTCFKYLKKEATGNISKILYFYILLYVSPVYGAMEGNNHLFGSFWVEGLTNDKGTVHTKCVRGPAKAFYF